MSVALPTRRGVEVPGRSIARLLREVARRPAGRFGLLVIGALLVVVIFTPLVSPYDPAAQHLVDRLQGPSWRYPLGTDDLGRDLLSRIFYGARVALGVAVPAVVSAVLLGLLLGTIAGYAGGKIDNALIVVFDTLQAFPAVILALAMISLLGPSLRNVIIVIIVSFAPGYGRVSRALVLSVKQNSFIEAERSLGASDVRIAAVHVVRYILAHLCILLAMDIPSAIVVESGLSVLGLGVQPPTPSWGSILSEGFDRVRDTPWPVLWTGLALMITTLGFTMFGETLRDVVDPRFAGLRRLRRP
jgi:peptide/nickel transport system permease protein